MNLSQLRNYVLAMLFGHREHPSTGHSGTSGHGRGYPDPVHPYLPQRPSR